MQIEFEATFPDVDKNDIRTRLQTAKAKLIKKEFLQKRVVFHLPKSNEVEGGWLRVRDEGDKITMSLKIVDGDKIEDQKEICLRVDNLEKAEQFLIGIGCRKKAFQETKRELWILDGVEITIDEWPFLEPFVEVEGSSKDVVEKVCLKLGFDYETAVFGAVDILYSQKYGISQNQINHQTPKIVFSMDNPFI